MTNFEKIKGMNKAQMRKFLAGFMTDNVIQEFCKDGCPVRKKCHDGTWNDLTDRCPTDNAMMRWWLEQEVTSK